MSVTTVKDALSSVRRDDAPVPAETERPNERKNAGRKRREHPARVRGGGNFLTTLLPLLLALVLLGSWYVSTANGLVNPLFLPSPADVFASLSDGLVSGM